MSDYELDLSLAIDPPPPTWGNFVHYDFLKLQYISHKMRHVSPLRVEALSCNNKITCVTLEIVKNPLLQVLKYHFFTLMTLL